MDLSRRMGMCASMYIQSNPTESQKHANKDKDRNGYLPCLALPCWAELDWLAPRSLQRRSE